MQLLKKRLQRRFFPVDIVKLIRKTYLRTATFPYGAVAYDSKTYAFTKLH